MLAAFLAVIAVLAYACSPSAGEEGQQNQAGAGGDTEASPSVPPEEDSESGNDEEETEPTEDPSPSEEPAEDAEGGGEEADGDGDGGPDGGSGEAGGSEIAAPESAEDPCRPQDVVVSFDFEEKKGEEQQYPAGVNPSFVVEAVNTGEQTCTVDVGPEALEMVITSGQDSVYSTSHCRKGDTSDERQLDHGRTHRYVIDWARERSFSDCRGTASAVGSGWYHAELGGTYSGGADDLRFRIG
ncbi:hypothetical protein GCM10007147_27420 [Nocardiopsis kunsanensis]|uniref:DUF4232 domain-containing protein n=1 Tax=Nocardiopsis kunsanensis TaxID=141693 RepID=A0A918XE89_9ACTN|nr:hypothetical protein GCM10007147_27420 [Nocardiopsis kunsanensis]